MSHIFIDKLKNMWTGMMKRVIKIKYPQLF
jgi:hypothetical protein